MTLAAIDINFWRQIALPLKRLCFRVSEKGQVFFYYAYFNPGINNFAILVFQLVEPGPALASLGLPPPLLQGNFKSPAIPTTEGRIVLTFGFFSLSQGHVTLTLLTLTLLTGQQQVFFRFRFSQTIDLYK